MVYDPVPVVRFCIMPQMFRDFTVFCHFFRKVCHAGVEQFQTPHPLDIGCDHQAVHPFQVAVDPRQLRRFRRQGSDGFMKEIHTMLCFIRGTPCAETAKCPVAERLFRKRRCVEGILKPNVKHQGLGARIYHHLKDWSVL